MSRNSRKKLEFSGYEIVPLEAQNFRFAKLKFCVTVGRVQCCWAPEHNKTSFDKQLKHATKKGIGSSGPRWVFSFGP